MKMFFVVFLLGFGGAIYAYTKLRAGEVLRFETSSAPKQVVMTAISVVGNKRRWMTLAQGDGGATFSYHRGANALLKLIAIFCILSLVLAGPAIVYLVLAGKKEAMSIATDTVDQMTIVQTTSNGWRGKSAGRALKAQMGLAGGTVAAMPPVTAY